MGARLHGSRRLPMSSFIYVQKSHSDLRRRTRIQVCRSFACRFRGLMFRRSLQRDQGLLLVGARDSRIDSAIHMLFVPFDIAVFWIDAGMRVVDKTVARAWRLAYAPARAARFILEVHAELISEYDIGDQVEFIDA
jgi:uncharacterized protein